MKLKNVIKQVEAFNYMISKLELQSGLAKRNLLETEFMTDVDAIEQTLLEIQHMQLFLENPEMQEIKDTIKRKLLLIKDIGYVLNSLSTGLILDDIELFEIKNFCLVSQDIRTLSVQAEDFPISIPDLTQVLDILDPDRLRMNNFYIYDSYSNELELLRVQIKTGKAALESITGIDSETYKKQISFLDDLFLKSIEIEDSVRAFIASQLCFHIEILKTALNNIARLDIVMAKAFQSHAFSMNKPAISQTNTVYRNLFNPQVRDILQQNNKIYQPIDIQLFENPYLITGANMAGKTIMLQTLQLSQYLFQFGFFVPAKEAQICIVDAVLSCMEDEQTATKGLSSFAAEILHIDEMMNYVRSGKKVLILIDELARTTNPIEGSAIINSLLDFLYEKKVQSVITTHFTNITAPCKKLRVKGFTRKDIQKKITSDNINDFMDYRLIEDNAECVPMEALRIAEILGVDEVLIEKAKKYLSKQ